MDELKVLRTEKGKCDMCGDEKEDEELKLLEDKELNLSLTVCEDCIEYCFERVGILRK